MKLAGFDSNEVAVRPGNAVLVRNSLHWAEHQFLSNPDLEIARYMHQEDVHVRMAVLGRLHVRRQDPKFNLVWRLTIENQSGVFSDARDAVVNRSRSEERRVGK